MKLKLWPPKHTSPHGKTLDLRGSTPSKPSVKKSRSRRALIVFGVLAVLLVAIIIGAVIGIRVVTNSQAEKSKSDMQKAVAKVGKLMILPTGETPSYGTVYDATKLKSQTFFAKADGGDQVLIYQKAKITILYRPSINKIVNVGPVVIGKDDSPYIISRFAIVNGSGNDTLMDKMTTAVTQAFPNGHIVSKTNASRAYPTTISIDQSKKNQPLDEQIADTLGIQAGKQPLGENLPDADIVIIIGADYLYK